MNEDVAVAIRVMDDLVPDCDKVVEWLEERNEWVPSTTVGGRGERTSDTQAVPFLSYGLPDLMLRVNAAVWHALDEYAREWRFGFAGVENVSVQRYAPGQRYGMHYDGGAGLRRIASALLYLNDVDEGGETVFPEFGVSVTPRAGRLALFPASYPYAHEALPPVSGVKYAAAYWTYES